MIQALRNLMLDGPSFTPMALKPMERLKAMGEFGEATSGQVWLMVFLLLALLLIAAGVVVLALVRHWRRARQQRERLAALCQEHGLGDRERYVMAAIVKAGRIRQVETVFTVSMSFERGLAALMRSPTVMGMTEQKRQEVRDLIESVRQRLGLVSPEAGGGEGPARPAAPADPIIGRGDRLMVVYRGAATTFDVDVSATAPEEFLVQPRGEIDARPGETWLLRYAKDGAMWEFDAPVMGTEGGQVRLGRVGRPRFINRRRFPRVPTSKPAQVANFPFTRPDEETALPEMVDCELTEIAGPGLRVEAPIQVVAGDRVLLAVQLGANNVVEGLGKVRRAHVGPQGGSVLVVELLGLNNEEVARLAQETSAAARVNARADLTPRDERTPSNDFAPRDPRGAPSPSSRDPRGAPSPLFRGSQEAPSLPAPQPQGASSAEGKEH